MAGVSITNIFIKRYMRDIRNGNRRAAESLQQLRATADGTADANAEAAEALRILREEGKIN